MKHNFKFNVDVIMETNDENTQDTPLNKGDVSISKNYNEPCLRRLDPLTDEQKRAIFSCVIEHITLEEAIERYGYTLTEDEKLRIRNMR